MMMNYTQERFPPEQLKASKLAPEYLTEDGEVKNRPNVDFSKGGFSLLSAVKDFNRLDDAEAQKLANILGRCLKLNPDERASADELLSDPWFEGGG